MSTQKIGGQVAPENRLLTSYEGQNVPDDFNIPPNGIEDVDRAMFKLFHPDGQVPINVTRKGKTESVETIFAAGERFATRRRQTPIRDDEGQFILPLVHTTRTKFSLDKEFMGGRGMGIDTGDLVIKQKLDRSDRSYQAILNKLSLRNQANVASPENFFDQNNREGTLAGRVASRREGITKSSDELLDNGKVAQNIYEIITMPFPQFFVASYTVTFWAQYQTHMNQMIERVFANFNPNQHSFKLEADNGYWFVAYFDDEIPSEDNSEDFTDEERVIKHTFTVEVPSFLVAPRNDGDPVPFRRYISAPQISFGIYSSEDEIITNERNSSNPTGDISKFTLGDVTPLDIQGNPQRGRVPNSFKETVVIDPISGKKSVRFVRIISKNTRVGETVIGADFIDDVDVVLKK